MLQTAQAVAFVPSVDLDRSERFFRDVLGLALESRSPYACVFAIGGATLRVTQVESLTPQPFTVLGWEVDDARATAGALAARGTPTLRYDGIGQDEDGIWTTPTGDLVAWFHDPDGNVLSLTQLASPGALASAV
jgi:catechol 2,3-dioxygenase-like lactoylglutathione lyase family enzyme